MPVELNDACGVVESVSDNARPEVPAASEEECPEHEADAAGKEHAERILVGVSQAAKSGLKKASRGPCDLLTTEALRESMAPIATPTLTAPRVGLFRPIVARSSPRHRSQHQRKRMRTTFSALVISHTALKLSVAGMAETTASRARFATLKTTRSTRYRRRRIDKV